MANGTKGTAVVSNASTGACSYTANAGTNGTDTFSFRVFDGTLNSNVATLTVIIPAPPSGSVVLQGTVTDHATGQPLVGAKVYRHGATNGPLIATTDANGHYFVDGSLLPTATGPITFQVQGTSSSPQATQLPPCRQHWM